MMADSLFDLLKQYLPAAERDGSQEASTEQDKYLSRILSLRLTDLTTTEPESLHQSAHSANVSIQALSSRSYRTTTASFDHLSTIGESLQDISSSVTNIKDAVPQLDESAVGFATSYSKLSDANQALDTRKKSMLLARQADKVQDILELPALLSAAIASASNTSSGGSSYSQALDLFTHIKRLQILYPDSKLVKDVQQQAKGAMKDMTSNLLAALRSQNIRLAAAIRTIGWLRRVLPELDGEYAQTPVASLPTSLLDATPTQQDEDDFGAIFLCARLCTFINMTEALAPLRDLADQETTKRQHHSDSARPSEPVRRPSQHGNTFQGQQTERYLKRYIEIFREQSFATISMFRNVFPPSESKTDDDQLKLPSAMSTFPLHLVDMLMETLRDYLPNITDPAARESLLMQVLYAANSLGRLGADFSLMIASLPPAELVQTGSENEAEPEWARIIKKHRVQAARLEAMAAGQDQAASSSRQTNIAVR
jgi:conserved oligomeric Golgi complex subunit 8